MSAQEATTEPGTHLSVQPTISRNVRLLLVAAGWNQGELAERVGLTEPQVSRKMAGKKSSWTPDDLTVMAAAFSRQLGATIEPGMFFRSVEDMITIGSFSSWLESLPEPTGQGSLLDDDGSPLDFFSRPFLSAV